MSAQKSENKKPDAFSGRLIDLFDEVYPSFLEEEIPESDMERLSAEKICEADWNRMGVEKIRKSDWDKMNAGNTCAANPGEMEAEKIREKEPGGEKAGRMPRRFGWKRVAVFSGFAAAGSAAVTGLIVFACMRHSYGSAGAK